MVAERPLRVALAGPGPQRIGGTGTLIRTMLKHLPTAGVEARYVVTNATPSFLPRSLDKVRYLRTGLRLMAYSARLARAALWADVIHAFSAAYLNFLLEPLPAILVGRLLGKRVVLNYHTGEAEDHLRRWHRLVRWAAQRADVLVVPSEYLDAVFRRAGMAPLVIPNAVDIPAGAEARPQGRVIVNSRALELLYDIPSTLKAFAIVQRRYPDAQLLLLASGSEESRCRRLATQLGLQGVEFMGGVAPAQVVHHLCRAALFLNSSVIDNQPLSILEAFACGVPVVSTAAGGIVDLVKHRDTGMLAPVGDHRALAEHACEVFADRSLARRLVQGGRIVAARHTWEAVRSSWLQVYGAGDCLRQ